MDISEEEKNQMNIRNEAGRKQSSLISPKTESILSREEIIINTNYNISSISAKQDNIIDETGYRKIINQYI